MRSLIIIFFFCWLVAPNVHGQTPSSQTMIFAGIPSVGVDYSKKISRKKWSSGSLSIAASPNFYFRKFNFDLDPGRSKFTHYRIVLPVTLRFDFYLSQIIMPTMAGKKVKFGFFVDAGYCASYSLRAHLHEEYFSSQSSSVPYFVFDGDITSRSEKLSFFPTVGFGIRFGRVVVYFRYLSKFYQWTDRSRNWDLPKGETSYFYSWEYTQPGVMICLGFQL